MPAVSRHNRISALLVALLYVFFSTFGAVAHTHASAEPDRTVPFALRGAPHAAPSAGHVLVSAQRDCAACEWQALSVTQVSTAQPPAESALLRMVPSAPSFSVYIVCLSRFSSRGPPTA